MGRGLDLKSLVKAMKDVDQIVTPRYQDWLIKYGNDAYAPEVVAQIAEQLSEVPRERSASFSASSSGQCARRQVFQYLGAKQPPTGAQLQNIFNDGKWRHLRWQAALLSANILTDIEEVSIWKKMRSRGTLDGVGIVPDDHPRAEWRGEEFGFELKGVSTFLFPKYKDKGPRESDHLQQIARYFLMQGYRLFVVIYEDKSTQEWKEWVVDAESEQMKRIIAEQKKELEWLNHSVEQKQLPAMLAPCAKGTGTEWINCPMGGKGGVCDLAGAWPTAKTPGLEHSPLV